MINVFFDCEMTHLAWGPNPEPPGLISIGCVTEDGREFYAENADYQEALCNGFVQEIVLPLLEGGEFRMNYVVLAKQLKAWIEAFHEPVKLWTDAPGVDWPHVKDLFDLHGWPKNLEQKPAPLAFANAIQQIGFEEAVEDAFDNFKPALRRHHALDDALANRYGYLRVMDR